MLLEGTYDRLFSPQISGNLNDILTKIQACARTISEKSERFTLSRQDSYPPPANSLPIHL
jgi:hypothetical protein